MPGEQTGEYGHGTLEAFWRPYSIKSGRDQPGNPKADGERGAQERLPSTHSKVSPEKAKKILKDGSVRGHELTPKQRGFFGAVAGRGKK